MADVGFGWSLYGFFGAALVWLAVYFFWAWRAAERDRVGERSQGQDVHGR